ncbi:hypothetical protein GCM10011612_09860 [Actinomyces gaoshouyii]|uniref:Uncharacterized protein n=1 Tax=Actinomyces gaoshouyii TaxID=1960083 RepID=A0A8H9H8R7_9ACTO|nr:hypothetical protein GCM10011612_09860 [Actinomyces gaoshouyii]
MGGALALAACRALDPAPLTARAKDPAPPEASGAPPTQLAAAGPSEATAPAPTTDALDSGTGVGTGARRHGGVPIDA